MVTSPLLSMTKSKSLFARALKPRKTSRSSPSTWISPSLEADFGRKCSVVSMRIAPSSKRNARH
jgi:hypothetical protein